MTKPIAQKITNFFTAYPARQFDKRQLLIQPNQPLPGVFYLTEGRVSQYDVTAPGNEVVLNVFKSGAFFPMSAALNGTPNKYFFEASLPVKVHIAPPQAAVQFLQDNPDVTLDLLKRVYKGVDGILQRTAHLMGGDAKQRLLFEILNAAYRFGQPQPDETLQVPLTESDLAKHSGMARETVSRHIQALKATGLLTVHHGGITIPDLQKLEALLYKL